MDFHFTFTSQDNQILATSYMWRDRSYKVAQSVYAVWDGFAGPVIAFRSLPVHSAYHYSSKYY